MNSKQQNNHAATLSATILVLFRSRLYNYLVLGLNKLLQLDVVLGGLLVTKADGLPGVEIINDPVVEGLKPEVGSGPVNGNAPGAVAKC
jgi:hypothetical protein